MVPRSRPSIIFQEEDSSQVKSLPAGSSFILPKKWWWFELEVYVPLAPSAWLGQRQRKSSSTRKNCGPDALGRSVGPHKSTPHRHSREMGSPAIFKTSLPSVADRARAHGKSCKYPSACSTWCIRSLHGTGHQGVVPSLNPDENPRGRASVRIHPFFADPDHVLSYLASIKKRYLSGGLAIKLYRGKCFELKLKTQPHSAGPRTPRGAKNNAISGI